MSERHLSDNELHELVPTLPIEDIFLIEFKRDDKWSKFVDFDGRNLTCNICNSKVFLPSFSNHCSCAKHRENFNKVQRMFHPKRTQAKSSNDKLSEGAIKQMIEKAKQKAVDFNKEAQRIFHGTVNKKVRKLILTTNVRDPKQVYVTFGLPLAQLVQLEYLDHGNWKPLLTAERLSVNSRFFCHLCQVYCGGVITVGAHFGGNAHMNLQLSTQGVRHKIHKHLTKNCRVMFSSEYKMLVNPKGKQIYKERAEKWLNEIAKLSGGQEEIDALEDIESGAQNDRKSNDNSTTQPGRQKESVNGKAIDIAANILGRTLKSEVIAAKSTEEGLIGVEYVVRLLRPQNLDHLYECVLCETVYTEGKMQVHLVSHDHRLKYCDIHYTDTMKKYKDMVGHMRYNDFYCCMSPLLSKLSLEIEKVHSRALPSAISEEEFMKYRADFVGQIYAVKHACQAHGPSFSKVVSKADIEEFKKNRHNFKEPTINNKPPCRFTETPKAPYLGLFVYNLADRLNRPKVRARSKHSSSRELERERDRRSREKRNRSKSPIKSSRSSKRERERSVDSPTTKMWKQYDKEVALEKKKIDRQYDDYRKQPEDHPLYEQEWNRFWKQRRDELIAEGIDHRTYNYQAEWVHYFKNRLEELFCEAVRQVKDKVRARLKMPIEAEQSAIEVPRPNKMLRFNNDPFGLQQINPQQQQQQQQLQQQFAQQQQQLQRFGLPGQGPVTLPMVQTQPQPVIAPVPVPVPEAVRVQKPSAPAANKERNKASDDRPNVIHVLRLLTAMEDHLGSLGSKMMDLFTKALQLEKKCSNNAALLEKSLLTAENCNLLEVAMEKLRGVVYAGLLEGNKANSFNKIIQATEDLLNYAEMKGFRDNSAETSVRENSNRSSSNSNNASIDIQKFLNAIQHKSSVPASQQKSLSDTLKELMSGKDMKAEAEVTPERSPRVAREDHFRNLSPPSYAHERSERKKPIINYNMEDDDMKQKLNLSVRIPNTNFRPSDFNMEDRNRNSSFNISHRDVKHNFSNEQREFEASFNSSQRDIKPNLNLLESPRRRQHLAHEYDDRKYSRSNDFNIHSPQDKRANVRQLPGSPTRPSAGEIRLRNFNELSNRNTAEAFLQNKMANIGTGSSFQGHDYDGNIPNSNAVSNSPMGRFEPKMSMQQFTRNISNYYQNRK